MEKKHKGREWVKTVAIIFLLILLILTFFSNTIMNMTLAEVSTVEVKDGSISAKVRATGKVTALGNNEVKAEGTRTIAAVKVKEGQEVNEGDILFVMGEAGSEELENATDARDSAYFALRRQQASYPIDSGSAEYERAYNAYWNAVDSENWAWAEYKAATDTSSPEYQAAAAALVVAETKRDQSKKASEENQNFLLSNLNGLKQVYENRYSEWYVIPDDEAHAEEKAAAFAKLENANYERDKAQLAYDASFTTADPIYNQYIIDETDVATKEAILDSYTDSAGTYKAKYDAAVSARISAESALTSAESSYKVNRQSYNQSVAQQNINTEEAQMNLDKQQAKVDNLSGVGEDINVYAKVSGIVSSLSFSSGDKVTKDDVMCTIEVPDMGYKLESTVTKDQASRIKVGDVGEQTNYYWGKSITGTISSIRADPKSPQDKRIVTFDLEGDVTSGQELTLSVGSRTASYDYIVPKSAVKSDNNGNFVLKIESKNNALGNRYFAKRVTVEILAEDDSYRAISGDLGYGDFVITNSSTKVNPGDQVRLADSNG